MFAFRGAASCEPTKAKPYLEPLEAALFRAEDQTRRAIHEAEADTFTMFLGGTGNFRYDIYPDYKANRKTSKKPTWYQEVRAHLISTFNATIINDIETDDAMGIEQCAEPNTIIITNDKDLLMIPGEHYDPIKQIRRYITPLDGLKYFYQQLIQGDQADNIPGYDGKMRPKIPQFLQPRITELWEMDKEEDMYGHVLDLYSMDKNRLVRNARLLWIQRKEGDIWQPPDDRLENENS